MFGYYLALAVRSLRRNAALTTLMVAAIGIGIGRFDDALTVLRAMAADPIPEKSSQLFMPQIDSFGPQTRGNGPHADEYLLPWLSYRDTMALMSGYTGGRQVAMYSIHVSISQPGGRPFALHGRAASADFFKMFEVPFHSGSPWGPAEDGAKSRVVVLGAMLAQRLFPHGDAVGKSVMLDERNYRVIGVLEVWNPTPQYYDLNSGGFDEAEQLFIPFATAIDRQVQLDGGSLCLTTPPPGWFGHLNSECVWTEMWVELPTAAAVSGYRRLLYNYADEQRRLGRFHWRTLVQLPDVAQWLAQWKTARHLVPDEVRESAWVACGFLLVCLINVVGLMLAKFTGRAAELGVRRAMGADRTDIFLQCLVETGVVGAAGGLLGLTLTALGLAADRAIVEANLAHLAHLDSAVVAMTVVLAVGATLCSGLYPTWRASRVQPALQLKAHSTTAMEIVPIVSALRRNKVGAILIALQIALTLAIVCNTLAVIRQHWVQMQRPSGIDEPNLFILQNQWLGDPQDLEARVQADLVALRSLPGVVDVQAMSGIPLHGAGGAMVSASSHPDPQLTDTWNMAGYWVDEHGLAALGVKLIAGRWFRADEIGVRHATDLDSPAVIILTSSMAQFLFPHGDAMGQVVYLGNTSPTRVIGIVERVQTPWATLLHMDSFVEHSAFLPSVYVNNGLWYMVRTRPGLQASVMKSAPNKLYELTQSRIIDSVSPFLETRRHTYARARSSSIMLGALSALLLTVTAFGVVGLTSYWVAQRRRQIGMRRALGATRVDILRYFHTENLLVSGTGALLGIGLCVVGNLWLAQRLALTRMSPGYIGLGALIVLMLSQLAVVWPALRAASVSPAIATRGL